MNKLIDNYPLDGNINYSEEQIKAIELEDCNILVSAAAGSGKTKVLVERIVKELETGICNINEMLVMTFTRAATAEMKNRIKNRIEERINFLKLSTDIEDRKERLNRLKNQSLFIQNSNISTIDSFCKRLVDENFQAFDDLDAKYRVADENELNILKSDLLDRFLETKYGDVDKEYGVKFDDFFKCYYIKNDKVIKDIILKGISFLETLPYVDDFFDTHLTNFDEKQTEINNETIDYDDEDIDFLRQINDIGSNKKDKTKDNEYILLVLLKQFYEMLQKEKMKRKIVSISDFQKFALRLLTKVDENGNNSVSQFYQQKFKRIMVDEYQDTSDIQEELLKAISNDFKNNNVFMVGDVKQCIYAFRNAKPDIFNKKYKEYNEDVNEEQNKNGIRKVLIKLNKNYRSSKEVIDTTNIIFDKIMLEEFGNINYKEEGVSLVYGRKEDPDKDIVVDKSTEIINFCKVFKELDDEVKEQVKIDQLKMSNNNKDNKNKNYELNTKWNKSDKISYVFDLITKLHDEENINYKDIVILHPTPSSLMGDFAKEAAKRDIPFIGNLKVGFYNSYEIILMIAILSIIDNPVNDVDLTTVLLSKMINITDDELLWIKYIDNIVKNNDEKKYKYFSLYNAIYNINYNDEIMNNIIENNEIDKTKYNIIKDKIKNYFKLFDELRQYQRIKSVSELITIIYDKANMYNSMRTMKNGELKIANLDLFLLKAKAYEKTSYSGLFNFLRYIEQIKTNEVDESPATVYDDNEDAIRLLSIHTSKGLEYPVVIMPNLESNLVPNKTDNSVLYDVHYGVGLRYINPAERYSHETVKRYLMLKKKMEEEKQEKIRLLYVGLTRAREKLVIAYEIKKDFYYEIFPKKKKIRKTKKG